MDYNAGQTIIQLLSLLFKAIQNDSPANYTILYLLSAIVLLIN